GRIPILAGDSGHPEIFRQKAFGLQPRQGGEKVAEGQVSGRAGNDQAADHILPPLGESPAKPMRFSHAVKKLFYGYPRQRKLQPVPGTKKKGWTAMDRFPEGGLRKWIPGWLGHYFSRSRRLEILLLIMMLLLVGSAWFFLELADAMMEGDVHAMDRILILALREPGDPSAPIGPPWMEEVDRDITALGSGAVLVLLVSAAAVFLALRARSRGLLYLLLVSTAGGSLMASILKDIFERSRPDLVTHLTRVSTSSFPSGHSVMAAVVYLTLGAILAGTVKP